MLPNSYVERLNKETNTFEQIYIGDENYSPEFKDLSLVTFKCPQNLGIVGIIGPTRMDYAKTVSTLQYINNKIKSKKIMETFIFSREWQNRVLNLMNRLGMI